MTGLNLIEGQKLVIDNNEYIVTETIKRNIMKDYQTRVNYYSYILKSNNDDVTHAELDYLTDDKLIFHLTKTVKSIIGENSIKIDGEEYSIIKATDEIYIDPLNGDLRDAKCYQVTSGKTEKTPSELHIHEENKEVFYLTLNLRKDDILIE